MFAQGRMKSLLGKSISLIARNTEADKVRSIPRRSTRPSLELTLFVSLLPLQTQIRNWKWMRRMSLIQIRCSDSSICAFSGL